MTISPTERSVSRPTDPPPPRRTGGLHPSRWAPSVILVATVIAVWETYVRLADVSPRVLPAPSRVAAQGWAAREVIAGHAASTLQVTLVGFGLALVVSWIIATAVDFSPRLRRAVVPLLVISQTVPIVALAPLMIIWFGFGIVPKLLVVALVTFFPTTVGLIEGFASADRESDRLLRSMGASRRQQFRYVRLPSAVPRFFTSLRIGITYAVVGAVFSEYVGATSGLGIYMSQQKNAFRTDLVLAAVVVTALCSIALFLSTYVVERLVAPWARGEEP
ncbi:ABC transporter permease [Rhodococcus corynebacterioides]|nr:ABC transporter permease [Rhodococcus corynebacterioides]